MVKFSKKLMTSADYQAVGRAIAEADEKWIRVAGTPDTERPPEWAQARDECCGQAAFDALLEMQIMNVQLDQADRIVHNVPRVVTSAPHADMGARVTVPGVRFDPVDLSWWRKFLRVWGIW